MRKIIKPRSILALVLLGLPLVASADSGSTDYSGSAGRLYNMVVYVVAMCSLVFP